MESAPVALVPGVSAPCGVGAPKNASLSPTSSASEKNAISALTSASSPRPARLIERIADQPITTAGGTKARPNHGSDPSRTKQVTAATRDGPSRRRAAQSAAPASAAAATGSGSTAVPCATSGGDTPTASAAYAHQGSGTTRRASRYD